MELAHKLEVADKHRLALRAFMKDHKLNVLSWSTKANLTESTLRNFLNGDSDSITSKTLYELAQAANTNISEILGEWANVDIDLLKEVLVATAEEEHGKPLDLECRADTICHLYEMALSNKDTDIKKEAVSLFKFIKRTPQTRSQNQHEKMS